VISELATRLDEQYPGWAERIDLDTLNMSDSGCCVIGQGVTNGDRNAYSSTLSTLRRDDDIRPISGFFLAPYASDWQKEIQARCN
jgi:hypothetical protein